MGKTNKSIRSVWKAIRVIWIVTGLSFLLWMTYSYQSRGFPKSVLQSDSLITVSENGENISFIPIENRRTTGFIFYPGAMVDPKAYAPMARSLAENGFTVYIVKLPLRSALLSRQEANLMDYTRQLMETDQTIQRWVIGGHSRGGAIASRFVYNNTDLFSGLILIGTSHPKDSAFDLSNRGLMVMKIYATHDGLASVSEVVETSIYLPDDAIWVEIDGGNHAQFGYYGTQLGDDRADINHEEQQEMTVSAILSLLHAVDA